MSSLRPAKIAASLFRLIGGSLADPAEPSGPPCACDACEQAWWRNQPRTGVPAPVKGARRFDRQAAS